MPYLNLSSSAKQARAATIIAAIGSAATMTLYTGSPPSSPDAAATGTALVVFPLSSPAGSATYTVQSCSIVSAGSGGSNGAQIVFGTTGVGTVFQAAVTVTGGVMTAAAVSVTGAYTVPPANLSNEPVTGAALTGAALSLVLTVQIILNPVPPTNAIASGTAGYARIATSSGAGILDLDCGLSASSVLMNSTQIVAGVPVACSNETIIEA